jgi:hypothetical protein
MPLSEDTVSAAVKARKLDKLKWLYAQGCPMPKMVSAEVAGTGNMVMLRQVLLHTHLQYVLTTCYFMVLHRVLISCCDTAST